MHVCVYLQRMICTSTILYMFVCVQMYATIRRQWLEISCIDLRLGGKSPVIVDETAKAAPTIVGR